MSFDLDNDLKLNLSGRIDRIDYSEDGKYFLIIDYKTGNQYINLVDVYYGLHLQLLTYLYVVNGWLPNRLPAAMLYCILKYPPKSTDNKLNDEQAQKLIEDDLKMPGWVLADPQVVQNIDKSLHFIKVKLKKDGNIYDSYLKNGQAQTAKEFDIMLSHVAKTLQAAGNRIVDGDIAVKPYKNKNKSACDWCPYGAVCGFDTSFKDRKWKNIPNLSKKQIFDLIQSENSEEMK